MMNINEIKEILPHRYPFLLVDKVEEITESKVVAYKNVLSSNARGFNSRGLSSGRCYSTIK